MRAALAILAMLLVGEANAVVVDCAQAREYVRSQPQMTREKIIALARQFGIARAEAEEYYTRCFEKPKKKK